MAELEEMVADLSDDTYRWHVEEVALGPGAKLTVVAGEVATDKPTLPRSDQP